MKCKECGARLDPVMETCPACGAEVEEKEKTCGKGVKILKVAVSVVLVLALLCGMVLVIFKDDLVPGYWLSSLEGSIPKDGNPDDVSAKGTYTSSRLMMKWRSDAVIAQHGNYVLNNGLLLVYYGAIRSDVNWTVAKADGNLPLDRQTCILAENLTWQQYLLQEALAQWQLHVQLCQRAAAAGYTLPEEKQQTLSNQYSQLYKDYVESGLYESVDAMLEACYGPGCTYADYLNYTTMANIANLYYKQMIVDEEQNVTEEDIEAFYEEQKDYLAQYDVVKGNGDVVVDVRHVLITVKQVTTKEEHIEESDWEATRVAAQAYLDAWLADNPTEESFAEMAKELTADTASISTGGLYTNVKKGQMAEEFDKWCFDASRQVGDYGLVRTDYGYHLMYFCGSEEYWHYASAANVPTWRANNSLIAEQAEMDLQFDYSKIVLWEPAYYAN